MEEKTSATPNTDDVDPVVVSGSVRQLSMLHQEAATEMSELDQEAVAEMKGIVTVILDDNGDGSIVPTNGGDNVFVHKSAIVGTSLAPGGEGNYVAVQDNNGQHDSNLRTP